MGIYTIISVCVLYYMTFACLLLTDLNLSLQVNTSPNHEHVIILELCFST